MSGIIFIWLFIIILNLVLQRVKKRQKKASSQPQDISCETQYGHVHPERGNTVRAPRSKQPHANGSVMRTAHMVAERDGSMRMGRPDLEPGYMYLNGVKVLIKEADKLEFLK